MLDLVLHSKENLLYVWCVPSPEYSEWHSRRPQRVDASAFSLFSTRPKPLDQMMATKFLFKNRLMASLHDLTQGDFGLIEVMCRTAFRLLSFSTEVHGDLRLKQFR